ncbi:hypothetical protein [Bradyrhizobium sp. STM 3557]|uniref:hypothetical protein n=1 Tax=Bradyrhizobium sp. STM 3557 TaxID=578920 RepID=UPI00388E194F
MMNRPRRRDSISRDVEIFSIAVKGIWGNDKLRTETNIWRMIARPDACGESNRRGARRCQSTDQSISIARRFGAAIRMRSGVGVRA